jgi:Tol biopolymer transport system component
MLRRRRVGFAVASACLFVGTGVLAPAPASAASTAVAPLTPAIGSGDTTSAAISQDGRWVAVRSTGAMVPGFVDGNGAGGDAFLVDTATGTAALVSHTPASAVRGVGADVTSVSVSDDGAVVVFATAATDAVASPAVTGSRSHAYRWVRVTGAVELVDVGLSGGAGNGSASNPRADGDGSVIAFSSSSTDLVAGGTDSGDADVFVADFGSGPGVDATTLVSHVAGDTTRSPSGVQTTNPSISADGRFVAYATDGNQAVTGITDANGHTDVYRYDRVTHVAQLVSRSAGSATTTANSRADDPSISADGRWVAYESHASNAPGSTAPNAPVGSLASQDDVFLWDVSTGGTELVSAAVGAATVEPASFSGLGTYLGPTGRSVSADGRFVAFVTANASALTGGPDGSGDGAYDAVVRDRLLDTTIVASASASDPGATAAGSVFDPQGEVLDGGPSLALVCDIVRVAFSSNAGDMAPDANPGGYDGFVASVRPDLPACQTPPPGPPPTPPSSGHVGGYWMMSDAGAIYAFGDAQHLGGADGRPAETHEVVDLVTRPGGGGYWMLASVGTEYARVAATTFPGVVDLVPGERATGISPTPGGSGYWVFTDRGRVFPFGDARNFGDLAALPLNGPVLDAVGTPTGNGYYMVASDGGVFSFGDAAFYGSTGDIRLNRPVRGLVPTSTNRGYWLVADDGGIFAFGDAPFLGSMGATPLNQPVVGAVRFGDGYLMVARDGGIFSFSNQGFFGSLGANPPPDPIVAVSPSA